MISTATLFTRFTALAPDDLAHWLAEGFVRPEFDGFFAEIDVARLSFILDLRDILDINEKALPVVLQLSDEVYALRRVLHSPAGPLAAKSS